jgi:hypothetical protein
MIFAPEDENMSTKKARWMLLLSIILFLIFFLNLLIPTSSALFLSNEKEVEIISISRSGASGVSGFLNQYEVEFKGENSTKIYSAFVNSTKAKSLKIGETHVALQSIVFEDGLYLRDSDADSYLNFIIGLIITFFCGHGVFIYVKIIRAHKKRLGN